MQIILKCVFFSLSHARTHARTPRFLSCAAASRPFSQLETAEGRQVLGLLAGHAPVVGLVDGLVVLPGRLVVDGQPLDGLGGQRLNRKTVTSQKGNGVAIICTSSFFFDSPECRWWRRCRGPPGSRGSAPPGSSGRTAGKWEGRSRSRPAHKHHHSYILQSSMGNVSKCTTRPTEDAPAEAGQEVSKEKLLLGFSGRFSFGCTELKGRVNN